MNMQNSPLLVAQTSPAKNATTPQQPKEMAKKTEEGQSFKQVLSKQVKQEAPKEPVDKGNKHAKQAPSNASGNGNVEDMTVDAQVLASKVVAKTIEEVTGGEVVLDTLKPDTSESDIQQLAAPKSDVEQLEASKPDVQQLDTAQEGNSALLFPLANMVATLQPNKVGEKTEMPLGKAVEDVLSKMKKPSADVKAQLAVKDTAASVKGKPVDVLAESGKLESNQFSQYLGGEKNTQFVKDASISQAVSNVTDVSTLATMSVQTAAKPFAQPVPTTEQVGFSNLINAAPGKTGWNEAIGQKVVWMVGAAEQSATLTLNPKDLGPLQVIINVNNEKADATFISENPEVRKALEDGMSNLKQSMGQAGVELGQTNVNTSKQQQEFQQANQEQLNNKNDSQSNGQAEEHVNHRSTVVRESNGLVDTFA